MKPAVLLTFFAIAAAGPAIGQSGLGLSGGKLSFGHEDGAGSDIFASASADFAITEFHGLQLDLGLEDTAAGAIGTAGAHLYMIPKNGQKYGLFAVVGDADDRSATYGLLGAEGLFAPNSQTAFEVRGGIGVASHTSLDFLFVEADIYHEISSDLIINGGITLAEFDEIGISATGFSLRVGMTYKPTREPWGVSFEIARDGLHGFPGDVPETSVRLGVTYEFGSTGGEQTAARMFRKAEPLRPLIRQGLF